MEAGTSLTSWQQAFEDYPIATTRTIEKKLRANATHNRAKLRDLVGGNYRGLLATADEIITLNTNTKDIEIRTAEIGRRCKPPSAIDGKPTTATSPRQAFIGELRLLQRCTSAADSALGRLNVLQCGQLLVISRLLLKALGEHETGLRSLDTLRERVAAIRRRLLRIVDVYFLNVSTTISDLIPGLCAYCLTTNNSANEAIKHIQNLRLGKLREVLGQHDLPRSRIVECLRYQISTMQALKQLLGRAVNDALTAIQNRAILEDPALRRLDTLALDSAQNVVQTDIFTFVPYFKRSQLSSIEVKQELETWLEQAALILSEGLQRCLKHQHNTSELLQLRQELFSCLLPNYFSIPGQARTLELVQHELSSHMENILKSHLGKLRDIASKVTSTSLSANLPDILWSEKAAKTSVSNGASMFLRKVQRGRTGIDAATAAVVRALELWIRASRSISEQFERLKIIRWQDMIEEPDEEQEEEAARIVKLLSQDQPTLYARQLRNMLQNSVEEFETAFRRCATICINETDSVDQSINLLRLLRLMMIPMHKSFPGQAQASSLHEYVPKLHQHIAREVIRRLIAATQTDGPAAASSVPENLPSPIAFLTLRNMSNIMSELGGIDLWSTIAISAVKKSAADHVFNTDNKARYVLNSFDEAYLSAAFDAELSDQDDRPDISQVKAAREYWSRTRVLFGLLA